MSNSYSLVSNLFAISLYPKLLKSFTSDWIIQKNKQGDIFGPCAIFVFSVSLGGCRM